MLAGLAGGLFVFSKGSVFPDEMAIPRSFDALIMVLLGGVKTLLGPLAGAATFTWLQDEIGRLEYWRLILGALIIGIVVAFPQGIAGFLRTHAGTLVRGAGDGGVTPAEGGGPRGAGAGGGARGGGGGGGRTGGPAAAGPDPRDRTEAPAGGAGSPLLAVRGLSRAFGGVQAVDDVSFTLDRGRLLALIGPNGAGKTTCFNIINGQLAPDRGSIRFAGQELVGLAPHRIWRLGVGRTFQITATYPSMTVCENVQMALLSHHRRLLSLRGRASAEYREEALALLDRVGMAEQEDRPCSVLAYGDLKRVELAVALANAPSLLLMDEPTAGMSPRERIELMQLTAGIVAERNIAVLFTEHDMDVVFPPRGPHPGPRPGAPPRRRRARGGARGPARASRLSRLGGRTRCVRRTQDMRLSVRGLHAYYGRAHILDGVSLDAAAGEVVAASRAKRRRQIDHPQEHHRDRAARPRAPSSWTGRASAASRRTGSAGAGSATSRRNAGCSRRLP